MALISRSFTQATSCISMDSCWKFKLGSGVHSSKTPWQNHSCAFNSFGTFIPWAIFSVQWHSDLNKGCKRRSGIAHLSATWIDSPFTERHSPKSSHGNGLLSTAFNSSERKCLEGNEHQRNLSEFRESNLGDEGTNSSSRGENESHESHLPELRDVLKMLRARWDDEAARGGRRRGPGNVYLVGTGPGDPELLTLKALRLMQSADLVLYDRLVSTDILDLVHVGARLLYVGKTSGFHSRTQEEIHELLLNFAEAGATVLRLKGGDPLVFGRGGEELDFLQEQGIEVKVVPGITAGSGIAAELGIPLTHRGVANSVRFLTGHSRKGEGDPLHVAEQAADPDSTLVIYMGLATLPGLAGKLIMHGLSPDTPAAAVERGTTPKQRMVFATLEKLPEEVTRAQLVSPTLIFIGQVVALSPLWPTDSIPGETILGQGHVHSSTSASPTLVSAGSKLRKEPRDRQQRSSDPVLPSQH